MQGLKGGDGSSYGIYLIVHVHAKRESLYPSKYPSYFVQDVVVLVAGVLVESFHNAINSPKTVSVIECNQDRTVRADTRHLAVSKYYKHTHAQTCKHTHRYAYERACFCEDSTPCKQSVQITTVKQFSISQLRAIHCHHESSSRVTVHQHFSKVTKYTVAVKSFSFILFIFVTPCIDEQ